LIVSFWVSDFKLFLQPLTMDADRAYNFSAGPAMLPESVLKTAAAEMLNFRGEGMGVMEMSHRGSVFMGILKETEETLRKIYDIPANYKVLFHEGGATHQFSAIPLNLMNPSKVADYFVTGTWSKKAAAEAKRYGTVNVICSPDRYRVQDKATWKPYSKDAAYVYYCDNETIEGVEFETIPEVPEGVPLIADMSSNFLSKRIDISKFGLIYACAQKNYGPAGLTVMIIREDLLEREPLLNCPTIMMNKVQSDNGSMFNTPASYNIYISGLVFKWVLEQGGLDAVEAMNKKKAALFYDYLDGSKYYVNKVIPENRSRMNVVFNGPEGFSDDHFIAEAKKHKIVTIKGHRSLGGFRASIYNAMPICCIEAFIEFMKKYAEENKF
jgi:phosphoserine aminotransferase